MMLLIPVYILFHHDLIGQCLIRGFQDDLSEVASFVKLLVVDDILHPVGISDKLLG